MAAQINISDSVTIKQNVDTVFRTIINLEEFKEWMPNFVRVEKLTDGDYRQGTRFRETRKMFGKPATEHFEVRDFVPGKKITLYIDGSKGASGKGEYIFTYEFHPTGDGGTRMDISGEMVMPGGWFTRLMMKLMAGSFRKALAKDHRAFARYAESK